MRYPLLGALVIALGLSFGCDDATSPTAPTSADTDIRNDNSVDVDVDVDIDVGHDHSDLEPTPDRDADPPGTNTPPPTNGQSAPDRSSVTNALYLTSSNAPNACADGPDGFAYIQDVVETLRGEDSRWGYSGKSGSSSDISKDTITYNLSEEFSSGDTSEVDLIDVVVQCGSEAASAGWTLVAPGHGAAYVYPFPG